MTPADLHGYLIEHIPLTRALALEVVRVDAERVELAAPLAANRNHRSTAFGGSVAALAMLAGWGWLRARLGERAAALQLVIQRQQMEFLSPIDADFVAACAAPADEDWQRFERTLAARARARLELSVEVTCQARLAAQFRGTYAAVALRAGGS